MRVARQGKSRIRLSPAPSWRGLSLAASAVLFPLWLVGCESMTEGNYLNCPTAAFLGGAEHIVQFRDGPGRGVTDIDVEADLDNLRGLCSFSEERVLLTVEFDIVAVRGVAALEREIHVPFFVAVTDAEGNILVKTTFVAPIRFTQGVPTEIHSEEIQQEIRLYGGQQPHSFVVLIGFQVTAEQLDYNEARRTGR